MILPKLKIIPAELVEVAQRLRIATFAFLFVVVFGSIGYWFIGYGEASILDSLYMTAITITTIGFHEVIDLSAHPWGRVFTIVLALMGFAVLTFFVSNVVALFIEGDFSKTFQKNKMERMINEIEKHYIICGCGRVGSNIAVELHRTERKFIAADIKEESLEEMLEHVPNLIYKAGDATDEEFLEELGATRAKGIFITSGNDNTNLVICLTARQINPNLRIVVRSKDINHVKKMMRAGADRVVTPNYIGGLRMASEMLRPTATSFIDEMLRSPGGPRIEELSIPSHFTGRPLKEIVLDELEETIIVALHEDNEWVYKPDQEYILKAGSSIILITSTKERKQLKRKLFSDSLSA